MNEHNMNARDRSSDGMRRELAAALRMLGWAMPVTEAEVAAVEAWLERQHPLPRPDSGQAFAALLKSRHSRLVTASEQSGSPDHPIREYSSLTGNHESPASLDVRRWLRGAVHASARLIEAAAVQLAACPRTDPQLSYAHLAGEHVPRNVTKTIYTLTLPDRIGSDERASLLPWAGRTCTIVQVERTRGPTVAFRYLATVDLLADAPRHGTLHLILDDSNGHTCHAILRADGSPAFFEGAHAPATADPSQLTLLVFIEERRT